MLLKSSLVGFFVWRAIVGLMPLVGGLVPLSVGARGRRPTRPPA